MPSRPTLDAALERRLAPEAGVAAWFDRHRLVISATAPDGTGVVVATQVSIHPGAGIASFQAAVVVADRRPVLLAESDIAVPARGWELRASGIWADHIVETPFLHWSYGLEAFALAVDDPDELLGRGLGERVPLGWELGFESAPDPGTGTTAETGTTPRPPASRVAPSGSGPSGPDAGMGSGSTAGCYHQVGRAHGLVLVGHDEIEIEGDALRVHRWGPPTPDRDLVGTVVGDGAPLALPEPAGLWTVWAEPGTGCATATSLPATTRGCGCP